MRQEIKSSSKHFTASQLKVGRSSVIIYSDDERIDIQIPDGISEGVELPPAGTVLRNVQVSVNGGGDTLYGFFPAKGTHIVRFERFSARDGEDPKPRTQPGGERKLPDGRKYYAPDRQVFTALLRVLAGDFEGCIIPWTLDYIFERDVNGSCFLKAGKKSMARLENFLTLCGFDMNGELRWTENILPDLGMMLSENAEDYTFQVNMKDGWIDEASELPAGFRFKATKKHAVYDQDEEDEFEERQAKRAAHKQIAKEVDFGDDEPEDDDDRPEVPAKKVVRPAQSKVTVKSDEPADDEDWEDDEPADKPEVEKPARPTGKKRDVWRD